MSAPHIIITYRLLIDEIRGLRVERIETVVEAKLGRWRVWFSRRVEDPIHIYIWFVSYYMNKPFINMYWGGGEKVIKVKQRGNTFVEINSSKEEKKDVQSNTRHI
jgi:hypothetical protein